MFLSVEGSFNLKLNKKRITGTAGSVTYQQLILGSSEGLKLIVRTLKSLLFSKLLSLLKSRFY